MNSRILFILCMLASLMFGTNIYAQTSQQGIVEQLIEESDSTLTIDFSPSLIDDFTPEQPVATPVVTKNKVKNSTESVLRQDNQVKKPTRTNGFRIQIFSDGRNQDTLQARARARAKKILSKYPKYSRQVYSFSKAPNYYTRIGNFATRDEANKALAELRRSFPEFAGEIRVVSSEVILNK